MSEWFTTLRAVSPGVAKTMRRLALAELLAAVLSASMLTVLWGEARNTTGTEPAVSLANGYRHARWQPGVSVSFPDACTMRYTSTGEPSHGEAAYYLSPDASTKVVATPVGHHALGISVPPHASRRVTQTLNVCPAKAPMVTVTRQGTTGWMISGAPLFDAYEGDTVTVANADNVSYAFLDADGAAITVSFLDGCDGHQTSTMSGSRYHYHGWSACLVDEAGDRPHGPSHLLGIALDGYPIYGDRDLNGDPVRLSELDACNGITSPTPEFPEGVYHYVLPSGAASATASSSPRCYRGVVPGLLQVADDMTADSTLPDGPP